MERTEAARILRSIAESIRSDPSQFHISVSVTGQSVVSHSGIGQVVTAAGGAPGSSTVGQIVSLEGAQVSISRERGAAVAIEQIQELVRTVESIAAQLESGNPETSLIKRAYTSLVGTWVPGVITSVIGNVLTMAAVHLA